MEYQAVILLILSLLMGSFISVIVIRIPLGEGIIAGRSKCRSCGHKLNALDLMPFFGWFFLGGKCRYCGKPISPIYPILEWAALGVFFWAYFQVLPGYLWAGCLLGWVLITLSAIDMRHYLLPNSLTLPLIFLGLGFTGFYFPESLFDAIVGAVAGYGLFAFIRWAYLHFRHIEALGLGDAKLLAAAGAWVGWQGLPNIILLASVMGLLVGVIFFAMGKRSSVNGQSLHRMKLPFGPFLALAFWLTWLYGPLI